MDTQIMFLGVIVIGLTVMPVIWPLIRQEDDEDEDFLMEDESNSRQSVRELDERLIRLIAAVHDLDMDFDTGKIIEADYVQQRKLLLGRGVSTLKRLDHTLSYENKLDDEIESLVTAYRQEMV